jgi:hypothetical protein
VEVFVRRLGGGRRGIAEADRFRFRGTVDVGVVEGGTYDEVRLCRLILHNEDTFVGVSSIAEVRRCERGERGLAPNLP